MELHMRSAALLLGALTLGLAAPAAAQNNTGGSGWQVNRNTVSGDFNSDYTVYGAIVGTGNPGVWQPNDASTQWISAWPNFSEGSGGASYVPVTDGNARWRYEFVHYFNSPLSGGTIRFDMGWDNILKSFQFDNGPVLSPVSTYNLSNTDQSVDDYFGFCRDGDAIWSSGNGVCTSTFEVPVTAGAEYMIFELWGDGITDGMWLAWDQSSIPTETVPEPATMTLLATGLAGMAAARRRRNANKA
jgi:hypothetical protein